jgi:2-amino-4-hydroxy-6-hydroxymethyldihydropteridine diphosphokinase
MSPTQAYLTLGSNIQPEQNLPQAVQLLRGSGTLTGLSSVYQTSPQGDTAQADFLNMAVGIQTDYAIAEFKEQVLASIEAQLGRVRDPHNKNAPRTIDLDIALWGAQVLSYGHKPWQVPDGDILRFAHVAIPLAELAPTYLHPQIGQTLQQIAAQFDASAFIRRQDILFDLVPRPGQ